MTHALHLACAVLSAAAIAAAEQPAPDGSSAAKVNVYRIDQPFYVDIFDDWKTIGRTEMRYLIWSAFEPGRPMIELRIEPSKAGQMIHGVQRPKLGLPLPKAVRCRVWTNAAYLWLALGDTKHHQLCSRIPLPGLRPCQWCDIEVPLDEMVPMGVGGKRLIDLDLIALLTRESAGEIEEDPVRVYLSRVEAVYPKDTGPTNATFTKGQLTRMLEPLPDRLEAIDALLAQARAKKIDVRYPLVSRTVLARYIAETPKMYRDKDVFVTKRTAEFLLACADRTEARLQRMIADPSSAITMPDVELNDLRCKQGTFHSGDRPVFLAGVCGWFSPSQFSQLSPMGYTCLSIETGPRHTLESLDKAKPDAGRSILAVMDAAAKHTMVCDLLVSPHYFPDWARKRWPGTDATGWRQKTNGFMPWTITDPHVRAVIAKHLEVLIPKVREHPALLSYDLINEAWYRVIPDFPASQWRAYRKRNRKLGQWQALSRLVTTNVTDFMRWYIAELHKHDEAHPVHIKTIDTPAVLSVDREAIGDVLTANGMDAMPSWPDWSGRLGADFAWPFLRHDFHRSLHPDQPILDGEYHISGGTYAMPDDYFRTALIGLALHGRDMTSVWVFDRVDDVSLYWHANGVEVLGHTALDLVRLAPEIQAFQRQRGPIALYYGGTQTSDAYRACLFQDLDVGILTDKRLGAGKLKDYRVLVIPFHSSLPRGFRKRIEAFRDAGGQVVRCPAGLPLRALWRSVRRAVQQAELRPPVRTDAFGIECRSVTLGPRKLFYVINHLRKPATVTCSSDWPLKRAVELRTRRRFDARSLELGSLECRLVEVR